MKEEEEKKAAAEGEKGTKAKRTQKEKPAEVEENKKEETKKEPPKPVKVWLYQTSIHDLLNSIEKMSDYDFVLNELGIMTSDLTEEKLRNQGKNPEGN